MNKELCDVQNHVIQKFGFGARASVIHAEMTTRSDVFELADVVILNNVFEWFVDASNQIKMWQFLCHNIKLGAIIVSIPSLEKAIGSCLQVSIEKWVIPLNYTRSDNDSFEDDCPSEEKPFLYQVIGKPACLAANESNGVCILPNEAKME